MGDKDNSTFQESSDEAEDTLSLCDLPTRDHELDFDDPSLHMKSPRTSSSDQDLFEFFSGDSSSEISPTENIVFCGKIIPYDGDELNEYQKRDYYSVKSSSFHKTSSYQISNDSDRLGSKNRSNSFRYRSSESHPNRCLSSPIQKVNITAITSMSEKSKRRMFMFGPVKFKPEMELSAIKKRQSRRSPAPMFPAELSGGEMVTGGGIGGKGSPLGTVRPLRCRGHLATALARSFGCISASMV